MENVLGITYDFKANVKRKESPFRILQQIETAPQQGLSCRLVYPPGLNFRNTPGSPAIFSHRCIEDRRESDFLEKIFRQIRRSRPEFQTRHGIPKRITSRSAISDFEVLRNGTIPCSDSKGYEAIRINIPETSFSAQCATDSKASLPIQNSPNSRPT